MPRRDPSELTDTERADRVRAVIEEELDWDREFPAWQINIVVPLEAGEEAFDRIRDAAWEAASQAQSEDREGWDIFCSATKRPLEVPIHMLRDALGDPRDAR